MLLRVSQLCTPELFTSPVLVLYKLRRAMIIIAVQPLRFRMNLVI